jgi:ABC-type dipeptide/oligopeptide/nickel transport system permease component
MADLFSNLPEVIFLLIVVAIFAFGGIRIGPRFVIRRLAGLIFVLFGVTFITFILGYVTPGTAVDLLCNKCTTAKLDALYTQYGLNLPWYQQYGNFLNHLLHFDLGLSFAVRGERVLDVLGGGVPVSAQLGLSALAIQVLIGVPVGIFAAVRAGSRFDTSAMSIMLVFFALPTFVTIPIFQIAMVSLSQHNLPFLPVSGWGTPIQMIAPIGLLALLGMGFYARLTRTTMLEVLGQDYVRTARAKGLRNRVVIWRHAFRNSMVPLVTALGPAIAFVVSGAFFTELLFNIPGIGFQTASSIIGKDMPVVQGTVIIVAVAVALMNLLVDVVYGILDPRIRMS